MKGGLLMAICYESSRHTRDIDFSTNESYTALGAEQLIEKLAQQLAVAEEHLSYGTACRVQSYKIEPKGENKTHQTLALKIGYADIGNAGAMKRLAVKNSPQVVEIDYSYNEVVFECEFVHLDGGATIKTYSLHNVIAEKLRSLLQQPIRKRNRRQDVYDICFLLDSVGGLSESDLARIFEILVESCRSKEIEPGPRSMHDEAVICMAKEGYDDLKAEVNGELPSFDESIKKVQQLYCSLPWGRA